MKNPARAACRECGGPCFRAGGRCRDCYTRKSKAAPVVPPVPRRKRRVYADWQRREALNLAREVGPYKASRRLCIPIDTLVDWMLATQACAYSPFVGRGRPVGERERQRLLEQLVHEQQIEQRYEDLVGQPGRRKFWHTREVVGGTSLQQPVGGEQGDGALELGGLVAVAYGEPRRAVPPHMVEWLDPVHEHVVDRLEAFAELAA